MKVETICERSLHRLDIILNDYISNRGYELYGDLVIHDMPIGETGKKEPVYFQRVIKKKEIR